MTTAPITRKSIFNRPEKAYVNPYLGGMILGIVLFLAFFLTGNGLGSSGATSRIDALIVDAVSPSHVDNNPYLLKMAGGDKNPLDDWIVSADLRISSRLPARFSISRIAFSIASKSICWAAELRSARKQSARAAMTPALRKTSQEGSSASQTTMRSLP